MRASRVTLLVEAIALHCRLRNYRLTTGNVSLLLLDEPFEGLAPAVTLELFKVFDQLRQHLSIVIVEHNLDLVLALADRVFALERGGLPPGAGKTAADRPQASQADSVALGSRPREFRGHLISLVTAVLRVEH